MKKTFFLSLAVLGLCLTANAKVELPSVISDNMVLQRNTVVTLWGKSAPSASVTVRPGWDKGKFTSKADKDGKWKVEIPTPDAGGPYRIEFSDGEKTAVDNVMIGEVWFCSGQSNMEMPMKGFGSQPVEGSIGHIISAVPEVPLRMFTVERAVSAVPVEDCKGKWLENTPENVANTSATAYYFAKKVQSVLGIPVGIIVSCWGGTPIQTWMDRNTISRFKEFDLSFLDGETLPKNAQNKPATLFNAMVSPLVAYKVKGLLWYQGEANRNNAEQYRKLQPAYVEMMREYWDAPEMPFYYVQLAPYGYEDPDGVACAELREAQMLNLSEIPNSGMAVTMDAGDPWCIHPADKETVGNRLAYLALAKTYGMKGFDAEAPVYESWAVKDGKIIVRFKTGSLGLAPLGHELGGFEVAGKDNVFYPATAVVLRNEGGRTIEVRCDKVSEPAAVRYGFHNVAGATLYNCSGIPASPFRTDMPE